MQLFSFEGLYERLFNLEREDRGRNNQANAPYTRKSI